MDKKKQLAELLIKYAAIIDAESVSLKDSNITMRSGHVEGVDRETMSRTTCHYDGNFSVQINFEYYNKDADKSGDAYNPMAEIRKEVGY